MPRACTVCVHPRLSEIDRRIKAGHSIPTIAKEFEVAESSAYRHRNKCTSTEKAPKSAHAGTVSPLEFLQARDIELSRLQEMATLRGHSAAACGIVRERRQIGESIEKLRSAADNEAFIKNTGHLTVALLDAIVAGEFNES